MHIYGTAAKRQAVTNPTDTLFSVKRLMGRRFDDPNVRNAVGRLPYTVEPAENRDARVTMGGNPYSPPEIAAMILQKLKADAEAYLGETVTEAVITVPAYFDDSQRNATKDAGRIAGLNVLRIINEPTAASLAYGLEKEDDHYIAVYDLGGGTFDISILETRRRHLPGPLSTNGNTHLGGDDFDQTASSTGLSTSSARPSRRSTCAQDRHGPAAPQGGSREARRSSSPAPSQSEVNLPFITADASGPKHLNLTLSRAKLEQLVGDLLREHPRALSSKALDDAGKARRRCRRGRARGRPDAHAPRSRAKGRGVLWQGAPQAASTRTRSSLLGAAIQAGVLHAAMCRTCSSSDVTPLTLGIETLGGVIDDASSRANTTIPTAKSPGVLAPPPTTSRSVEIHVLQGEREMAGGNKSLGRFILDGILPAPRGMPQIEVTFDIDANGILNVGAQDKGTGKEQRITIQGSSGLSDDEIAAMQRDAEEHAEEDQRLRELAEVRNRAETTAYEAEKVLRDQEDKLDDELKIELQGKIDALRATLEADAAAPIQTALDDLNTTLMKVGERVYGQQQAADSQPGTAPPDDDTVEGEFREV